MSEPLYSIGTYDWSLAIYTPQEGVGPCFNITRSELRKRIHELRAIGYTAHRRGNVRDGHEDNDTNVLIERTDGKPEAEILKGWLR